MTTLSSRDARQVDESVDKAEQIVKINIVVYTAEVQIDILLHCPGHRIHQVMTQNEPYEVCPEGSADV